MTSLLFIKCYEDFKEILKTILKVVTLMNKKKFKAEKLYSISLSLAKSMLEKGIISNKEYMEIDTILLDKYHPTLGTLLTGKPLT